MSDTQYKELNVTKAQLLILNELDEAMVIAKEDANVMHMTVVIMNKAKILGVTSNDN
jgi:hypothetical protein